MGNTIYSFSSISALVKGDYYPNFNCKEILSKGNFVLGTFEGLNGELITSSISSISICLLYTSPSPRD